MNKVNYNQEKGKNPTDYLSKTRRKTKWNLQLVQG
nr:MAG TPA: hypothetical protein [Caudoviricetes sp.]